MSINLAADTVTSQEFTTAESALATLVKTLESQKSVPSLKQIYDWLETANISTEELQPYIGFKDGNYWRHRICRSEFVEMLVLCWRPGHRTPIHDHNGSHGGVKVHEGRLWETIFNYDAEKGWNINQRAITRPVRLPVPTFLTFTSLATRM